MIDGQVHKDTARRYDWNPIQSIYSPSCSCLLGDEPDEDHLRHHQDNSSDLVCKPLI